MSNIKTVLIFVITGLAALILIPTPKGLEPQEVNLPTPLDLDSSTIPKNRLDNARYITTPVAGPEDVAFDQNGNIYSGLSDGSIIRVTPDLAKTEVIAKSSGAIFGIDVSKNGDRLVFADQISGIKQLDLKTGIITTLTSSFDGVRYESPNGVAFGKNDETLYFTVSSEVVKMNEFHNMILYAENSGRVFKYSFKTNKTELLVTGLYFANGVEYNQEDNALYILETSKARMIRYDLDGGKISEVLNNIVGYPDNVHLSSDGHLWIATPAIRDPISGLVEKVKVLRKISINLRMTLGMFLMVANMKYAGGIKVNRKTGEIIDYFYGLGSQIHCISGINENNGKLYLSSLAENRIAVVDLQQIKSQPKTEDKAESEL